MERTCDGQDRVEAWMSNCTCRDASIVLLQQWLGFVVDDAHAEAIRKLETILGREITVRESEDRNGGRTEMRGVKIENRYRTRRRKDRSRW